MKDDNLLLSIVLAVIIAAAVWYGCWVWKNPDLTTFQKLLLLKGR